MSDSKVASKLELRWFPVVDARGRTRMESTLGGRRRGRQAPRHARGLSLGSAPTTSRAADPTGFAALLLCCILFSGARE